MTAFINDVKPDMVYAQQVYGYVKAEDLVIGITTSGNSANVVNALRVAKDMGVKTVGLIGEKGGKLAEIADVTVKVPETDTYKVQEYHLPVYHYLCHERTAYQSLDFGLTLGEVHLLSIIKERNHNGTVPFYSIPKTFVTHVS